MKLTFQIISLMSALCVTIASAAEVKNKLDLARGIQTKNSHSLITHAGINNMRISAQPRSIEKHSRASQLTRANGNQQASLQPGTRTIIGSITYPKRHLQFTTAFGPVNGVRGESAKADTPFRIASLTKTFTATAIFKLIEQGKFTLDTPIKNLLKPETSAQLLAAMADPETISVRQLLGHRSGLFDYATTEIYVQALLANPGRKWTRAEQLDIALQFPPQAPDSAYLYSDTNYILLGDMIEKATGQTLATSYRSLLDYAGLGLKQTYLENAETEPVGLRPRLHSFVQGLDTSQFDASFDLFGGGGLVSTTKDLTAFYRALLTGRVVNKLSLEAMTSTVSGGGFGEFAYSLGLMPFFIGNNACYGHEGFASVVVGHCPAIDYTFVYAAGSDLIPGIGLTNQGIGYQVADLIGINVTPKPYARDIELTRCPPELPNQNANLTCGMMAVKESRGEANSKRIRFPFVIAKHPSKPAQIEPLLLLSGGPGDPLIPSLPNLLGDPDAAAALLDGQDIVTVEYRGVGESKPQLACDTPLNNDASVAQCVLKFSQLGVNLSRYNSVEIAADLEQLRRSLKVSKWNLLGFSYGTRIALTMLRERPGTIKSLSLDGAVPPEAPFANPDEFALTVESALANCQLNADCNRAFPQLKTRFIETLNSLNVTPIQINGRSISGDDVVQTLVPLQSSPEILAYLPAVLDGLAKRNIDVLSAFFGDNTIPVPEGKSFSTAMFFSTVCNEQVPFLDRSQVNALAQGPEPIRRGSARNSLTNANVCSQWPSGRADDRQNQAVPLTVPTIVFNGQFDLQTPPATGRNLGNSSPLARGFEFPAVGHIAIQQSPACALTILADFQRRQDAQTVDASCLAQLPAVNWKTKLDEGFFFLLGGS